MPNDVNVNLFSWSQSDYADEKTTTTVNIRSLADSAAYNTARNDFVAAMNAMTDGNPVQRTASLAEFISAGPSTIPASQREKKILVRLRDTVTNRAYSFSIGCRDDSVVTYVQNSDFLDLTETLEGNLVTAIEAFVASPVGNPVTVISMQAVGRNL